MRWIPCDPWTSGSFERSDSILLPKAASPYLIVRARAPPFVCVSCAPGPDPGLFDELAANALKHIQREREEALRRQRMLAEPLEADGADVAHRASVGDRFGCDADRFKSKTGKKPHRWRDAVAAANVVHID